MIVLWVALMGGLGALARFFVDGLVKEHWTTELPWATLLINATGSLLLGLFTGLVLFRGSPSALDVVGGTGFCGGYTTFSAASFETARLLQRRSSALASFHALATLVVTVTAGAIGLGAARL